MSGKALSHRRREWSTRRIFILRKDFMKEYSYTIADDLFQEISRIKYLSESLVKLCKDDNPFTYFGFELGQDVSVLNDIYYNLNGLLKRVESTEKTTTTAEGEV